MSSGNYDTRPPSASSQIITLERLLEEANTSNEKLQATIERLEAKVEACDCNALCEAMCELEATIEEAMKLKQMVLEDKSPPALRIQARKI